MVNHPSHAHPLTLITDTRQLYPEFDGQWQCDVCGKSYDKNHNSYNCSICKFDSCLTCLQPRKHPLHHPSHDLYFTNMVTVYPQYQGQWKCDDCHLIRSPSTEKSGYHCFTDQFDLCARCFNGLKFEIHRHPLKHANARVLYNNAPGLWMCDVCKRSGSEMETEYSWHCEECKFDVCQSCRDFRAVIPEHNHPLVIADAKKIYEEYNGSWNCDICQYDFHSLDPSTPNSDKPYHCEPCGFDVCHGCVNRRISNRFERDGDDVTGPPPAAFQNHVGQSGSIQWRTPHQPPQE